MAHTHDPRGFTKEATASLYLGYAHPSPLECPRQYTRHSVRRYRTQVASPSCFVAVACLASDSSQPTPPRAEVAVVGPDPRTATILKIITTVSPPPGLSESRTGFGRSQAIRFFPCTPADRMLNIVVSLQTPFRTWGMASRG